MVLASVFIWLLLVGVRIVNVGESPFNDEETPQIQSELLKTAAGGFVIAMLVYELIWKNTSPVGGLALSLLSAVITGMWLIGLAWFMGGLSGLAQIRSKKED